MEPNAAMSNSSEESDSKKLEDVVVEKTGALSPGDSIKTAGERMRAADANTWPVVEGRKLVGVIDTPNPDLDAGGHGHDPKSTLVSDAMRRELFFCYEDEDAGHANRVMEKHNLNHLTVVDRQMRIVGIISKSDIRPPNQSESESPASVSGEAGRGETSRHQ